MARSITHVLLVGPSRKLHKTVREYHKQVRISVICGRRSLSDFADLASFDRVVAVPEGADAPEWVAAARYLNAREPFDALLAISEDELVYAAEIGAELGLPTVDRKTVEAVNRKDVMRRILVAAGVDPTPNRIVTSAAEIEEFAATAGYPLICKPVSGSASQGISRIDGPDDVPGALDWTRAGTSGLASTEILVEPFHTGTEYSVECISEDGDHVVAAITAKYLAPSGYVELGHVVPAPLDEASAERIGATVVAALSALGVTDGVTHTEVMVSPDTVHIIETHLRPGGDGIPDMLTLARGIDLDRLLARQCLGESVLDEARAAVATARDLPFFSAIWYACPDRRGVLKSVEGLEAAAAVEGVWAVRQLVDDGTEIGDLTGSDARPAFAWAVGDTADQALAQARAAIDQLVFVTAP